MYHFSKTAVAVCVIGGLAACGGASTGRTPATFEAFDARNDESDVMLQRVDALFPTIRSDIPTTGSADFTGYAGLGIADVNADPADIILIIGDVAMTANFATQKMTGTIDNLQAATDLSIGLDGDLNDADVVNVGGQITIGGRNSAVAIDDEGPFGRNYFTADYAGNLRVPGQGAPFELDGGIEGYFKGNRVNNPLTDIPMKALVAEGGVDDVARQSGTEFRVGISIFAENNP